MCFYYLLVLKGRDDRREGVNFVRACMCVCAFDLYLCTLCACPACLPCSGGGLSRTHANGLFIVFPNGVFFFFVSSGLFFGVPCVFFVLRVLSCAPKRYFFLLHPRPFLLLVLVVYFRRTVNVPRVQVLACHLSATPIVVLMPAASLPVDLFAGLIGRIRRFTKCRTKPRQRHAYMRRSRRVRVCVCACVRVCLCRQVAVELVAHARASSCVSPWCKRLSELARAHKHAADNVLALLAAGRRRDSKARYRIELEH